MAKPELGTNLLTYTSPPVSVASEATLLCRNTLVAMLEQIEEVLTCIKRFAGFMIWKSYGGSRMYRVEIAVELMVYGVEHLAGETLSECKISVMFAGVRRLGHTEGSKQWNGSNDEMLWTGIILPRCVQHFT